MITRSSLGRSVMTSIFTTALDFGTMMGLVEGLKVGKNELKVTGGGTLELTDYSIKGPMVSGPQIKPFYCETTSFVLPGYPPAKGAAFHPRLEAHTAIAEALDRSIWR